MTDDNQKDKPSKDDTELKATDAAQFKKNREERSSKKLVTLPSGLKVVFKQPSLRALIKTGQIPDHLTHLIMRGNEDDGERKLPTEKQMKNNEAIQKLMVKHSLVQPKIVDEKPDYAKGEILVDDLDEYDQGVIAKMAMGGEGRPVAVTTFPGDA